MTNTPELTEAMIEAGLDAYFHGCAIEDTAPARMAAAYLAMQSASVPAPSEHEENYLTRAADKLAAEVAALSPPCDALVEAAYEEGWCDRKRAEIGQLAPYSREAFLRSKSYALLASQHRDIKTGEGCSCCPGSDVCAGSQP